MRHWHAGRQLGLVAGQVVVAHQFLEVPVGRRCEKLACHLDPRHLDHDPIGRHDPTRAVGMDAVQTIAHHRKAQVQKRRRLDLVDSAAQKQIDRGVLVARLVGAIDQIDPIGRPVAETFLDAV